MLPGRGFMGMQMVAVMMCLPVFMGETALMGCLCEVAFALNRE
jgi:hypothetical protein